MICEECKERHFRKMLAGADKAMKRYTEKLREEKYDGRQNIKK